MINAELEEWKHIVEAVYCKSSVLRDEVENIADELRRVSFGHALIWQNLLINTQSAEYSLLTYVTVGNNVRMYEYLVDLSKFCQIFAWPHATRRSSSAILNFLEHFFCSK